MTGDPEGIPTLWDWAVERHGRRGVEAACLALQDRHGMDVAMILWCTWAGEYHGVIDRSVVVGANEGLRSWRDEVVGPLRMVRRRLKHFDTSAFASLPGSGGGDAMWRDPLRARVADAELDAERIQIEMLDAVLDPARGRSVLQRGTAPGEVAVRANLATLVDACDLGVADERDAILESLIGAVLQRD